MQGNSLKAWFESDPENHWGLQVIVDTLATGENIPSRLISLSALRNLYDNIHDSYRYLDSPNPDYATPPAELTSNYTEFSKYCSSQSGFDVWVEQELQRIARYQENPTTANVGFVPLADVIHSLGKKVFVTLTSNELPVEMLVRHDLPEWEWFLLLWLYQHLRTEEDKYESAFGIPAFCLKLHSANLILQRTLEGVSYTDELALLLGPVVATKSSLFAEEDYDINTVTPSVNALRGVINSFSDRRNFSSTRVSKAIKSEMALPLKNAERRSRRLVGAFKQMLEFHYDTEQCLDAQCLRIMSFWCQTNIQRQAFMMDMVGDENPGLQLEMLYEPDVKLNRKGDLPLVLVSQMDRHGVCLTVTDKRLPESWMLKGAEYGSNLNVSPNNKKVRKALEEFAIKMGHSFLRLEQKARLQEQKELLIFTEWLQSRTGTLFQHTKDPYRDSVFQQEHFKQSSEKICRWIAESIRADLCFLFSYQDSNGKDGTLTSLNSYSRSTVTPGCRDQMGDDMERISSHPKDRETSISYRAVSREGKQQVCYSYDSKKGEAIPPEQTLYRSPKTAELAPPYRMVIATPIKFNNRLLGVIEISSNQSWRFRYNRQTTLKRIATVLAPFIYQHEHLKALHDIQVAILEFHADNTIKKNLFRQICHSMSILFLCKGSALWVRDNIERHLFKCEGFYNTDCYPPINDNTLDINDPSFISGEYIREIESKKEFYINKINRIVLKDHVQRKVSRHHCLLREGITSLSVIPVFSKKTGKDQVIATLSIYNADDFKYDEAWVGISQFVSSHLSFIIEAIQAFDTERIAKESLHTHELWHDISYLADKARKIAKGNEALRLKVKMLLEFISDPWFKSKLEVAKLIGIIDHKKYDSLNINKNELHHLLLQEVHDTRHSMDIDLFYPQQDMLMYVEMCKTRIHALFSRQSNDEKLNHKLYRRVLQTTGNSDVAEFALYNELPSPINVRSLYHSIIEGNQERTEKGLYTTFELLSKGRSPRGPAVLMQAIMTNLINNAIKYAVHHSHVTTTLEYQDNGILILRIVNFGMPMQHKNEYRRVLANGVRGSNKRGQEGLGMGLYIVDQICKHLLDVEFSFREIAQMREKSKYVAEVLFHPSKVAIDEH